MALTRKLPQLHNEIVVICPPSIICLDCTYWHDDTGCEKGEQDTQMAVFGCCDSNKPKNDTK